jgi:hypothetical protein
MDDSWVPVFSTSKLYQAEIVKEILLDNQIFAFVLNQQDSMYLFGDINVCVRPADVIRAKYILKSVEF